MTVWHGPVPFYWNSVLLHSWEHISEHLTFNVYLKKRVNLILYTFVHLLSCLLPSTFNTSIVHSSSYVLPNGFIHHQGPLHFFSAWFDAPFLLAHLHKGSICCHHIGNEVQIDQKCRGVFFSKAGAVCTAGGCLEVSSHPPVLMHFLTWQGKNPRRRLKKLVADKNISAIQPIGQPESVHLLVSNWLLGHHPYFNVKPELGSSTWHLWSL